MNRLCTGPGCSRQLPPPSRFTGRPRLFCSNLCNNRAFRARRRGEQVKTPLRISAREVRLSGLPRARALAAREILNELGLSLGGPSRDPDLVYPFPSGEVRP